MKLSELKIIVTIFIFSLLAVSACKKEVIHQSSIIDQQVFTIPENSPDGSVVDTLKTRLDDNDQNLSFSIIGGNLNDVFRIDGNKGIIYVNNFLYLDYETTPEFKINVLMAYGSNLQYSDTASVIIKLIDISPTTDGLLSYYDFNGNANDAISGYNGICNNVTYADYTPGGTNKSLELNGYDSYVNLGQTFDFEQMTISLWVNVKRVNSDFDLIYTSDNPALQYGLFNFAVKNDFGVDNLYFNISGQILTIPLEKGIWYNMTIVKNRKTYQYFLDGELVGQGSFSDYLTSNEGIAHAFVGCQRTQIAGFLLGNIDNLRIYNRVLSYSEIQTIFQE